MWVTVQPCARPPAPLTPPLWKLHLREFSGVRGYLCPWLQHHLTALTKRKREMRARDMRFNSILTGKNRQQGQPNEANQFLLFPGNTIGTKMIQYSLFCFLKWSFYRMTYLQMHIIIIITVWVFHKTEQKQQNNRHFHLFYSFFFFKPFSTCTYGTVSSFILMRFDSFIFTKLQHGFISRRWSTESLG